MSRNIKNVKVVQKYCKVCHDAGKTEAEYRSHFTRESPDPKAKVTCPTLLAQECRYCCKNGHTVKYCPTLKDNQKKQKLHDAKVNRGKVLQNTTEKSKGKLINKNVFMCLDSDSEEDVVVNQVEEFPALITSVSRNQPVLSNYAAALAQPAAPKQKVEEIVLSQPTEQIEVAKIEAPWVAPAPIAYRSWAAFDSDSEEDEEFPYYQSQCSLAREQIDEMDEDW